MRKPLLCILVSLITFSVAGQDLQALLNESNQQWENELYEEAFQTLNTAVEQAGKEYENDPEGYGYSYAVILNRMGIRLYEAENYEVSASYYETAIPIFKQVQGESGDDYLISVENLALCYNEGGFYEQAVSTYAILLENSKYQEQTGKGIYQTYNTAAICAYQADNYDLAGTYYRKGLSYLTSDHEDYWVLVENLIVLETTWSQYISAYQYLEPFLSQFPGKKEEYSNALAYYNRDKGHLSLGGGDYSKAIPFYKKTIELLKPIDSIDRLSMVYIYEDITLAYGTTGNYQEGLPYIIQNAKQVKAHYGENSQEYLNALSYLSIGYAQLAEYNKADRVYREGYKIIERLPSDEKGGYQALFDNNYTDFHIKQGDFDEAEIYAQRALDFYSTDPEYLEDKIYAMNMLSIPMLSKGQYDKAESLLKQALNLQLTNYGLENETGTQIASNMTSLYIQTGRKSRAEQFLQFILANDLAIHGEQSFEYSFSLQVAGVLYTSNGNFEKAIECLGKAYEIREPLVGKDNRELLRLKKTLGSAHLKASNLDESIKILNEVLEVQKATLGNKNFDISLTMNDLALAHLLQKDYAKAEKLFEQSYKLSEEVLGEYNQFSVAPQFNLACTNILMGNNEKAFNYFKKSIDDYLYILDKYFPYLSEKERLEYYRTIKGQLGAYFSFLSKDLEAHPEYTALLYDLQIKTKAILLSESLKLRNSLINHENLEVKNIFHQWNEINKEVAKLEQIARDAATNRRLDSLKIVGEEYERALNSMTNVKTDTKKKTWKDVAATLKDGEVAIEIIRVKDFDFENNQFIDEQSSYLALIIDNQTKEYPEYVLLENGFAMDSKYFNVYKNSIKYERVDKLSYQYFWQPIAEKLTGYTKAFVSSDGVYHLLNLNTLFNPSSEQYLISEFAIDIVGNTGELIGKVDKKEGVNDAVLFGFPDFNTQPDSDTKNEQRTAIFQEIFSAGVSDLPETKTEITNIETMMSSAGISTNTFLSTNASEGELKSIPSTSILHIATHGFFEESSGDVVNDDPLTHSGLLLANLKESTSIEEENGIITAKEVAQMNLSNNKLVVLSACETGKGQVVNGEGVYGLQRAFQVAGADNVIISLWKVDDAATQLLMTYFYEHYLTSLNPREALKKSQIQLQETYPHPNYWGAFYVVGK
ncbi:MAG: CHAT domain-containing protein [Ekhidna sp.]